MELYILNDLFQRIDVVDKFESLIWSERFRAYGDFELNIQSTRENRNALTPGTRLATNESNRVMTVKSFEDKIDSEGKKVLTFKGPSLEKILDERVAKATLSDLSEEPTWDITGPPAVVARKIFHDICILGNLDPGDVIPNVTEGSFLSGGNIAEIPDPITVNLDLQTVYAAIKNICDVWYLGFRLLRKTDSPQLYFDIYTGNDRTTSQTILSPVVFAQELDNLQNVTELTSMDVYKNVAYVFSPAGFKVVYPLNVDPTVAGFERRVLVVKADDITVDSVDDVDLALIQRGTEELSKNNVVSALDGEINQNSKYKYGRDYQLGDLVEMRNSDGATNVMRAEEQIFISDHEGDRSYPTLSINNFIVPGSWLSWNPYKVWEDLGTEHWGDL